jgi:hypothetical protein
MSLNGLIKSCEDALESDRRTLAENLFLISNLDALFGGTSQMQKLGALMTDSAELEQRIPAIERKLTKLRTRKRPSLKRRSA